MHIWQEEYTRSKLRGRQNHLSDQIGEQASRMARKSAGLTLGVVADLAVDTRRRKLNLMGEDIARRGGPVRDQAVVAGHPLGGDIRIHLDAVRVAIVGLDGNG